jgi:hypothetical protein
MYNGLQTRWQNRGRSLGSYVRVFIGRYEYRGLVRGVTSDAESVATGTCPVRSAQSMSRRGFQFGRTLLKRSRRAASFARAPATRRWAMGTSRSPLTATLTACRVWAGEWQRRWTRSSPNASQSVTTLLLPQTPERIGEPSLLRRVSPANEHILRVEPRGFEPLTSAVQSQGTIVAGVRGCSEMPAKSHICLRKYPPLFTVVRVGWCTAGVPQLRATPRLSRSAQALVSSLLEVVLTDAFTLRTDSFSPLVVMLSTLL